jgi:shikimate kinase
MLFDQRDPLYRETADIIVNVGKGSALNTVRKIENAL